MSSRVIMMILCSIAGQQPWTHHQIYVSHNIAIRLFVVTEENPSQLVLIAAPLLSLSASRKKDEADDWGSVRTFIILGEFWFSRLISMVCVCTAEVRNMMIGFCYAYLCIMYMLCYRSFDGEATLSLLLLVTSLCWIIPSRRLGYCYGHYLQQLSLSL